MTPASSTALSRFFAASACLCELGVVVVVITGKVVPCTDMAPASSTACALHNTALYIFYGQAGRQGHRRPHSHAQSISCPGFAFALHRFKQNVLVVPDWQLEPWWWPASSSLAYAWCGEVTGEARDRTVGWLVVCSVLACPSCGQPLAAGFECSGGDCAAFFFPQANLLISMPLAARSDYKIKCRVARSD